MDRHSTFYEHEFANPSLKWRVFHRISRYTVQRADVTVVTNAELGRLVASWSGRAVVLPDRLPRLAMADASSASRRHRAVFPCSHDTDEPVLEVLQAASLIPEVEIHITGDASASRARYSQFLAPNVHFTGYLPESAYESLLGSSDVILALTTAPNTLLCCAYEAVSLGRPLVVSDHEVLTRYFSKGRVVCENSPGSIAQAVRTAIADAQRLASESRELRLELRHTWGSCWDRFLSELESICTARCTPGGAR